MAAARTRLDAARVGRSESAARSRAVQSEDCGTPYAREIAVVDVFGHRQTLPRV